MAGESAAEVARRQRERAARLQRSAELWERGAAGEQETAAVLACLPAEQWTAIHDVRWPGRRYANVDHVLVGPGGVLVIDSLCWSGRVEVRDDVLRQNGRQRETSVAAAAEAALAVARLVPSVGVDQVRPVICFTGERDLRGWARDVMVCSTSTLLDLVLTRPVVLTPDQVRLATAELQAQLSAAADPASRPSPPRSPRSTGAAAVPPAPWPPAPWGPPARPAAPPARRRRRRGVRTRIVVVAAILGLVVGAPEVVGAAAGAFGRLFVGAVAGDPPATPSDELERAPTDLPADVPR